LTESEKVMSKPIVGWFEITGKDGPALQQFYSSLFDWEVTDAGSGYGLVSAGENGIAGGTGAGPEGHVVGLSRGAVQ
jgi:predicted enzyme related to lactoylglutathione lyase